MDGIHDLGGKHGYGKVEREENEPAFHEHWEAAVYTMAGAAAMAGAYNNTDRFRHAVERIEPVAYLSHTYYGRWLGAVETLLVEAGLVTQDEITHRAIANGASTDDLIAARPAASPEPMTDTPRLETAQRAIEQAPRFSVGDTVRTSIDVKPGHTRLPAYARGKPGRITCVHNAWVYPDTNAHGRGEQPQYLYTVAFNGRDLWGAGGDPRLTVCLDLFEPYLEHVDE